MKWILKTAAFLCLLTFLAFMGCRDSDVKTIVIGFEHFTEQEILGEIMAILIEENTDFKVVRKLNLGGTMICFNLILIMLIL